MNLSKIRIRKLLALVVIVCIFLLTIRLFKVFLFLSFCLHLFVCKLYHQYLKKKKKRWKHQTSVFKGLIQSHSESIHDQSNEQLQCLSRNVNCSAYCTKGSEKDNKSVINMPMHIDMLSVTE